MHRLSEADRRDFFLEEDLLATAVREKDVSPCDKLAASPSDPLRTTKGVPLQSIVAQAAIEQCETSVKTEPRTPRYRYQLGRAFEAAQKLDEARVHYQEAATAGYPVASLNLGLLFLNGRGVPQDSARAAELFRTAFSGEVVAAGNLLATVLSENPDRKAHDEADRIWSEAARRGDPYSNLHIAKLSERAVSDATGALKSYAIAEWLFNMVGDTN